MISAVLCFHQTLFSSKDRRVCQYESGNYVLSNTDLSLFLTGVDDVDKIVASKEDMLRIHHDLEPKLYDT